MPALTIPVYDLDSAGKDYAFPLDAAWFVTALEGTEISGDVSEGPGRVSVHAQLNGREVLVHGRAHATFSMECARCLEPVPVKVACDLAALYAHGVAPEQTDEDDEDIDPGAPDHEFYTGDALAIDGLVRDYLLLELPMKATCAEGTGCSNRDITEHLRGSAENRHAGESQKSIGEGTIDPRLMPLMKLAKGEREKE